LSTSILYAHASFFFFPLSFLLFSFLSSSSRQQFGEFQTARDAVALAAVLVDLVEVAFRPLPEQELQAELAQQLRADGDTNVAEMEAQAAQEEVLTPFFLSTSSQSNVRRVWGASHAKG
jgi:hypothetical protein